MRQVVDPQPASARLTTTRSRRRSNIQVQARRPNGHPSTTLDDVRTSFGRPGPGYMTDTQIKDTAYADYARDLENAWRGPSKAA
jgi:hypothetical protein